MTELPRFSPGSRQHFERDIVEIQAQIDKLLDLADRKGIDVADEVGLLRAKLGELKGHTYDNLKPIEQVQVALAQRAQHQRRRQVALAVEPFDQPLDLGAREGHDDIVLRCRRRPTPSTSP